MKSAITICLVKEAAAGPFVFHTDLAEGCAQAAKLGFDAVEVFPPEVLLPPVVLLPPELRAWAGLEREVVFMGLGNRFEIWDKARYDALIQRLGLRR